MKLLLNLRRISPSRAEATATGSPTPAFTIAPPPSHSVQPSGIACNSFRDRPARRRNRDASRGSARPDSRGSGVSVTNRNNCNTGGRRAEPVAPEDLAKATGVRRRERA